MRIVVFSDSHKNFGALHNIVLAQPEASLFLHLGDGEQEFEKLRLLFPDKHMHGVAGNCDWGSDNKVVDVITCQGKRIFLTHGHIYGVKNGLEQLLAAALAANARIVLYGHTHMAYTGCLEKMYLMNPGSISSPSAGPPTYGIIDITEAGIFTSIVRMERGKA